MASTDFSELKAVVTKNLETSGVLSQIRAQLRASVYHAIQQPGKSHGTQLLDGLSAALCAELIAEFFEFHGFLNSLRVFQIEAQLTLAKRGRSDVAADAGLRAVMVGCSLLEQLLGVSQESNDCDLHKPAQDQLDQVLSEEHAAECARHLYHQKSADSDVLEEELACTGQHVDSADSGAFDEQGESSCGDWRRQKSAEAQSAYARHGSSTTCAEAGYEMSGKEGSHSADECETTEQFAMTVNDRSVLSNSATATGVAQLTTAQRSAAGTSPAADPAHGGRVLSTAASHGIPRGPHKRLPPLGESAPGLPPVGTQLSPLSAVPGITQAMPQSLVSAASACTPPQTPSGTMSPSGIGTPVGVMSPAGSSATLGTTFGEEWGSFSSLPRTGNPLPPLIAGASGSTESSAVRLGRRRSKEKDSKRAPELGDLSLQHDSSASTIDPSGAPQISAASRLAKALKGTTSGVRAPGSESDEDVFGNSASCDSFSANMLRQNSESVSMVESVSGADTSFPTMDDDEFDE